jgi:outer membrane protein OmpA-like peptidoglycan-associated protein
VADDDDKKLRVSGVAGGRKGGKVLVRGRREGVKVADRDPDQNKTDITGLWEEDGAATLRINRAGEHIEGWLVDYQTKQLTEIGGDLQGDEIFEIRNSPAADTVLGTLHVIDDRELRFFFGSQTLLLRRVDREPGISDNALQAFPPDTRARIRDEQRRPLSSDDRRRILRGLTAAQLGPFIDQFLDAPTSPPAAASGARAIAVQALDRQIGRLFNALHPNDQAKAASLGRFQLGREQHTAKDGRTQTLLAWIQSMVLIAGAFSGSDPVPNLRTHFGLTPTSRLFHYTMTLTLGALASKDLKDLVKKGKGAFSLKPGFGGGFFDGKLEVQERTGPRPNDPIIAQFELPVAVGQVGVGVGVSLGSSGSAQVSTPFHWTALDFPGSIGIIDLSGGAFQFSRGVTGVFFGGSGTFPELAVDFTGGFFNLGAGAGFSEFIGRVLASGESPRKAFDMPEFTPYTGAASSALSVHFPFGIAELTDEAKQLLRVMAAQELSLFRAGFATLVVEAHADRVDTEAFNELLTKVRAFNTVLGLKDILGKSYKVQKEEKIGLGETGAIKAGDKDNTENPARRRADVTLNGRLVVQLRGEGKSGN